MRKESLDFLRQLIDVPSPSGYEMRIQDVVRKELAKVCDEVRTDVHGNVIGVKNPSGKLRLMLAGHCDEIGFIVTHVDDKGFISFSSVGGIDAQVVVGQRVLIHSDKGSQFGVIGRKAIHLMDRDEQAKSLKLHDLWIDIGASSRKDAEKVVSVGDYVTFDVGFKEMRNGLAAGHGFDDRAGAFVVVEAMRLLADSKLDIAVFCVTSVQEEIGLRGARTSAFGIDPHAGIAVDVGHASDYPGADAKRTGECVLGKGPALHRGPNINPALGRFMEATARKKKIPFQLTAEPSATGTDANAIQITRSGVAAALMSIPNRYMHTPVEIVSLKDIENAASLLAEVAASMKHNADFIPGLGQP